MVSFEQLQQIALALPGVEEGTSYGTPAFKVRKKLMARLWEDGEVLVVKIGFEEAAMLMEADPDTYFITDHYRGYPAVLVRLARIDPEDLRTALEQAWRFTAQPKS